MAKDKKNTQRKPTVDIVIPVYNEEAELEQNILDLDAYLRKDFPYAYRIIIANNASTDHSLQIAKRLSKQNKRITFIHLYQKGRGRALRKAWMESSADIVSYMDVDLSTNLSHFKQIVEAIAIRGYDLAVGSRLMKGAEVERGMKRQILSTGYNFLLKVLFAPKFTDAQCGFKALRTDLALRLLPLTKDQEWFFDTELLLLAERLGIHIFEQPVVWIERKKSKVRIFQTVTNYLLNILRMRFSFWFS